MSLSQKLFILLHLPEHLEVNVTRNPRETTKAVCEKSNMAKWHCKLWCWQQVTIWYGEGHWYTEHCGANECVYPFTVNAKLYHVHNPAGATTDKKRTYYKQEHTNEKLSSPGCVKRMNSGHCHTIGYVAMDSQLCFCHFSGWTVPKVEGMFQNGTVTMCLQCSHALPHFFTLQDFTGLFNYYFHGPCQTC